MRRSPNFFRYSFTYKETRCTIISDNLKAIKKAWRVIIHQRRLLEDYIEKHPIFLYSLQPLEIDEGPEIVRLMASASAKAGVGPMAAVAGVLADQAVRAMTSSGAKVAVVENGGEISAISEIDLDVALLAGSSPLSGKVGFRLDEFPIGIATSSGIYGHALSLGKAEAVTIFSSEAGLADAAATAVCNVVKGEDVDQALRRGVKAALAIDDVRGALIIYGGKVAIAGRIPKLINVHISHRELRDTPPMKLASLPHKIGKSSI